MLCCRLIDASTTSNDVRVKSKFALNAVFEPKVDLHISAIRPTRDRVRLISRQIDLVLIQLFSLRHLEH